MMSLFFLAHPVYVQVRVIIFVHSDVWKLTVFFRSTLAIHFPFIDLISKYIYCTVCNVYSSPKKEIVNLQYFGNQLQFFEYWKACPESWLKPDSGKQRLNWSSLFWRQKSNQYAAYDYIFSADVRTNHWGVILHTDAISNVTKILTKAIRIFLFSDILDDDKTVESWRACDQIRWKLRGRGETALHCNATVAAAQ